MSGVGVRRMAALYLPLFILGWLTGQAGYSQALLTRAAFTDAATSDGNTFGTGEWASGPAVSSTNPGDGSTGVPTNSTIAITFNTAMDTDTIDAAFSASPAISDCTSVGNWAWSSGDTVATCTLTTNLSADTLYTLTIGTAAESAEGTALASA